MSEIYREVKWVCPKCNHPNTNTFLEIELHPVECTNCQKNFDVYLKVKLDIKISEISDGTCSEEDIKQLNSKQLSSKISLMRLIPVILIIISIFYRPNNTNITFIIDSMSIVSSISLITYLVIPRTSILNKKKVCIFLAIYIILLFIPNIIIIFKAGNLEFNWIYSSLN